MWVIALAATGCGKGNEKGGTIEAGASGSGGTTAPDAYIEPGKGGTLASGGVGSVGNTAGSGGRVGSVGGNGYGGVAGSGGGAGTGGAAGPGGASDAGNDARAAAGPDGAVTSDTGGGARDGADVGGASAPEAGSDARDASASDGFGPADAGGDVGGSLAANSLAVRFANAVMTRWPDPSSITSSAAWEYNHGIVLRGIEQVYRRTSDPRYLAYIKKYADSYVNDSGVVNMPSEHSFDNIQPSVLLPFLFQQTGSAKYHLAADSIRARYDSIPRNVDNGFWHKQTYPNQMWLDGVYMGMPFLARYAAVFGTCGSYCGATVVEQVQLITQHGRDTTTGLLYHAWDDSPAGQKAAWADPTTGRSPVIWGRALGWYAMALVDTLGDLPAAQSGRTSLLATLVSLAAGLQSTQDATTGLWYQVLDQGSKSDDWLETSGSGMFVYALKVAVARGYIDASYLAVASRGWQGLQTKVTTDSSGLPTINGAVQGMGVQTSYAGYVNQTALSNSPHGLCAILLAASEMEAR
jgi:unsaturated rhamnogalacturonyl hydrolase